MIFFDVTLYSPWTDIAYVLSPIIYLKVIYNSRKLSKPSKKFCYALDWCCKPPVKNNFSEPSLFLRRVLYTIPFRPSSFVFEDNFLFIKGFIISLSFLWGFFFVKNIVYFTTFFVFVFFYNIFISEQKIFTDNK